MSEAGFSGGEVVLFAALTLALGIGAGWVLRRWYQGMRLEATYGARIKKGKGESEDGK